MKKIALIGSTGSIGRQAISVVERHPDKFEIVALVANRPSEEFAAQASRFPNAKCAAAVENPSKALDLAACEDADIVLNAASGFAGLEYSIKAISAGKRLALANKETLVCGGNIVMPLAEKSGVEIIPVDSEHSAIWQCLNFNFHTPVKRFIITASGGAFRGYTDEMLKSVTPQQALNHPTWQMGAKITVDCATLANKGYEVIEAHTLYGTPYSDIHTVIQPQSIVHSLVEFADGSYLAQLSYPTMELPIQLALSYPERLPTSLQSIDFTQAFGINFEPLVRENYPLYDLALRCGEEGGTLPCAFNAADEVAVAAFLRGCIAFTDIYGVVASAVASQKRQKVESFEQLKEVDAAVRAVAEKYVYKKQK